MSINRGTATKEMQREESGPRPLPFLETGFGKLPLELRLEIYEYVLGEPPTALKDGLSVPMVKKSRSPSRLSLLGTCCQIYNEACGIFYSKYTLFLSSAEDLLDFLTSVGPVRRQFITSLHLGGLMKEDRAFSAGKIVEMLGREPGVNREALTKAMNTLPYPEAEKSHPLLADCGSLRKLYLEVKVPDELQHIRWLTELPLKDNMIDFQDPLHWGLTAGSSRERYRNWDNWYHRFLIEGLSDRKESWFNPNKRVGSIQRIEVDIRSHPDETFDVYRPRKSHRKVVKRMWWEVNMHKLFKASGLSKGWFDTLSSLLLEWKRGSGVE